jgi:uncharacterized membrane protein YbhN (UPF0104 family)
MVLQSFPMLIVQVKNNRKVGWTTVAIMSFLISLLLFLKDLAIVTVFLMKKFINGTESVSLRPKTELITKKEP